jgi:signal transduction histidine kinase
MSFLVDDLLDFAQLNAGKFRRTIANFDLKDAVEEVISIQKDKAKLMGVKLTSTYKYQSLDSDQIVSLFN